MNRPTASTNKIWPNWIRWGGIDGLIWGVMFVIGAIIIQGEPPMRDDSIETIREYFTSDADAYLIGDYILTIAFVFFFLPYVVALGWLLIRAEGTPPIWSTMAIAGGFGVLVVGAAQQFLWGALALGLENNPELDDAMIRYVMDASSYAFNTWSFFAGLFLGSAGFVILRTGALWRWLGGIGMLAAVLLVIGAAWPIDGDEEGALGIVGFPGILLTLFFILASSVGMVIKKEAPMPDGAG